MKGGVNMKIGEKIRAARIAKGLTQEELGEILGVQKSAVAKYESGRVVNIKRSTLKKISDALGIRPSELFFEEEKPTENGGLSSNQRLLIDLVATIPDDKTDLAIRVLKSLLEGEK